MHQGRAPRAFCAVSTAIACGIWSLGTARAADVGVLVGAGDQSSVDVAAAGGSLLVVWQDDSGSDLDIRAVRVDSGGTVLGAGAFDVCTATGDQSWPAVASDGTDFLVVWQDERNATAEIWAVRVASDGSVVAPGAFLVSTGVGLESCPDVAYTGWTGFEYLVVWQDSRAGGTDWNIYGARVDVGGTVKDAGGLPLVTVAGNQDNAAVASDGGDALVVYRDANNVKGVIVDSDGAPSAPIDIGVAFSTQKVPAVAFGRGVYLVAWEDYRNCPVVPFYQDIYAARVSASGELLDPWPHVPVAVDALTRSVWPAVAFDGANFVVAWEDGPDGGADVYVSRVLADADGISVREPRGLAVSPVVPVVPDQDEPSIAPAGTGALVVWADWRGGNPGDVYAAALGTDDPPVALVGTDILTIWDSDVVLDGEASYDPEGLPLTYSWVQVPGSTVTLLGPDTDAPSFTAPGTSETLTFELTVSDGTQSAAKQMTVTVVSPPPSASGLCGASGAGGSCLMFALLALAALARRARASGGRPVG